MISNSSKLFLVLYVLLTILQLNYGKDITVKDLKCEFNHDLINNVTCKVKPVNGKNHVLDFSATLLKEVKEIIVGAEIYCFDQEGRIISLMNITEDFCKFMESKSSIFYTTLIEKLLRDISNVNHACPYSGYVYVDSINPDATMIPPNTPIGEYTLRATFSEGKPEKRLGRIDLTIDVVD